MRDPERIDRLLEKLRIIWYVLQDQRLGQLMNNFHRLISNTHIFHVEDDEWERLMDKQLFEWDKGWTTTWFNRKTNTVEKTILFRDRIWLVTKDELYED